MKFYFQVIKEIQDNLDMHEDTVKDGATMEVTIINS